MALINRCDGCHQSFNDPKITAAPILIDETWAKLAGEQETLCAACFFDRAIELQIDVKLTDSLPCAFNLFHWPRSWYDLFLSKQNSEPANIDEWRQAMMTLKLLSVRVAGKPSRCGVKDHVAARKHVR
jgi:hypothetical protein